jgi:hypothetical protein
MKEKKRSDLRAMAEYYAQRARRQTSPYRREHLAKAAEYYRELAKLDGELANPHIAQHAERRSIARRVGRPDRAADRLGSL